MNAHLIPLRLQMGLIAGGLALTVRPPSPAE